jgi:hypothetical protein
MNSKPFTEAAKEILSMPDADLAKLFEEAAVQPVDPFLSFAASSFLEDADG